MKLSDLFLVVLPLPMLKGCQSDIYLVPTAEALLSGEHDPFAAKPDLSACTQYRTPLGGDIDTRVSYRVVTA